MISHWRCSNNLIIIDIELCISNGGMMSNFEKSTAVFVVPCLLLLNSTTSVLSDDIVISYDGELSGILDAATAAYMDYYPFDWINDDRITIYNCARSRSVLPSDLPQGYSWTWDGYDETDSLAWALDDYALMMASFRRSGVPHDLIRDVFGRLETRFAEYQEIYFDGLSYGGGYGGALEANLPGIFSDYGIQYPGLYYEDGCGGALEISFSTEPAGARVWRTTPLRMSFCSIREQNSDQCHAWNEVTGQDILLEQGDIVLYAQWQDGREVQSYRDLASMPDPATIVLRPE